MAPHEFSYLWAMFLQHLSLVNFKNYGELEVELSAKINCFTGNNGVGKTNILDAIYYLSFCKSFLSNNDAVNIKHGDALFVVEGRYQVNDSQELIYCGFETGKRKRFKRNKKEYDKLADHIGLIPLVMISPYDINLITGGSDERRKFIDGIISQFDREYLFDLQRYNRVLSQRNFLLKQYGKTGYIDDSVLDIYDEELVETGQRIHMKRQDFVSRMKPVFQQYFTHISKGRETVSLIYNSGLSNQNFREQLQNSRDKDKQARFSTVGIHKDDLDFMLGDFAMRRLGSQGQQKSYLVALKLAQFEFIYQQCGFKPLLLLDDVFDKLDSDRVAQIIKLVAQNNFGQIFITDTNPQRIHQVLSQIDGEYYHYHVSPNQLERVYETI
ncbi:MAG: DNA replication/repair protein RecF [Salinivirgaceae bacterium]